MARPKDSLRAIFEITTACAVLFAAIAAVRGAASESIYAGISALVALFIAWLSGRAEVRSPQGDVVKVLGRTLGFAAEDAPLILCTDLKRAVVVLRELTPALQARGAEAADELGWSVILHDADSYHELRRQVVERFMALPGVTVAVAQSLFDHAIYDYEDLLAINAATLAFATGLYGRTKPLLDEARRLSDPASR